MSSADTTLHNAPPDLPPPAVNPYLVLAIATLAVSSSAILIKLSSAPPLTIATYRLAITTALLAPLLRRDGYASVVALNRRTLGLIVVSGALLALHFATWTASLRYTSVASSVLFVSVHPMLVALAAWLWLGERVAGRPMAGIVLTLLGSAVIAGADLRLGAQAIRGDALALAGAVVFAGYLLIGRGTRQSMGTIAYSVPVYGVCTVALLLLTVISGQSLTAVGPRDLAIFVALAIVPTIGGHLLYNWALRFVPAAVVSVSFLGEPVGASLLAWPILGQALSPSTWLGGAVIVIGIWLTARW